MFTKWGQHNKVWYSHTMECHVAVCKDIYICFKIFHHIWCVKLYLSIAIGSLWNLNPVEWSANTVIRKLSPSVTTVRILFPTSSSNAEALLMAGVILRNGLYWQNQSYWRLGLMNYLKYYICLKKNIRIEQGLWPTMTLEIPSQNPGASLDTGSSSDSTPIGSGFTFLVPRLMNSMTVCIGYVKLFCMVAKDLELGFPPAHEIDNKTIFVILSLCVRVYACVCVNFTLFSFMRGIANSHYLKLFCSYQSLPKRT